jgi:molybdenum cofactor biosynthesis enzyme MoaA
MIITRQIQNETFSYDTELDIVWQGAPSGFCPTDFDRTQTAFPVDLCIEVTTTCNLRCRYCFARNSPGDAMIDPSGLRDALAQTAERYIRVCITGGEPFMHPKLEEICSLLLSFEGLPLVINTNGTSDPTTLLRRLQGNVLMAFSIHGAQESHNSYTRSVSYETTVANLCKAGHYATTHMYCVVHEGLTPDDVGSLLELKARTGSRILRFVLPRDLSGSNHAKVQDEILRHCSASTGVVLKQGVSCSYLMHANLVITPTQ